MICIHADPGREGSFGCEDIRSRKRFSPLNPDVSPIIVSLCVCLQQRHHLLAVPPARWSAGKPSNALQPPPLLCTPAHSHTRPRERSHTHTHGLGRQHALYRRKHVTQHAHPGTQPCAILTQRSARARVLAIVSKFT